MPLPPARMAFHSTTWSRRPACNVEAALPFAVWVQIATCKVTQGSMEGFQAGKGCDEMGRCVRQVNSWSGKKENRKEKEAAGNPPPPRRHQYWLFLSSAFSLYHFLARAGLTCPTCLKSHPITVYQIISLELPHSPCHSQMFLFITTWPTPGWL